MIPRLFLLTLILFCFELGFFLVVLPWSTLWEHNYFLFHYPALRTILLNHYLRGGISGLGLVDIGLALWYAAHFRQVVARWLASAENPAPASARGADQP